MEPRWSVLTVDQTARLLQFSPAKVRGLLDEGVIPGLKVGGTWRIHAPSLYAWLNGRYGRWPQAEKSPGAKGSEADVTSL